MDLIIHAVILVLVGILLLFAIGLGVLDMADKAESVQKRFPRLERVLKKKEALPILLVIAILMQIAVVNEVMRKEVPEKPEPPHVTISAQKAPDISTHPSPKLLIVFKDEPLTGKTIHADDLNGLNFPEPLEVKNIGDATAFPITVRIAFSEVVSFSLARGWDSSGIGEKNFPFELWTYANRPLDAGERWIVPPLIGRQVIAGDRPISIRVRAFYGAQRPAEAIFKILKVKH